MIEGFFYPKLGHVEPHISQPSVSVDVALGKISRLSTLRMLIDTGADRTSLAAKDAYCLLGGEFWRVQRSHPTMPVIQASGQTDYFYEILANIVLSHDKGPPDSWDVQLEIPQLDIDSNNSDSGLDRWFSVQLQEREGLRRQPSILGRDILWRYALTIDYGTNQVQLESSHIEPGGLI